MVVVFDLEKREDDMKESSSKFTKISSREARYAIVNHRDKIQMLRDLDGLEIKEGVKKAV